MSSVNELSETPSNKAKNIFRNPTINVSATKETNIMQKNAYHSKKMAIYQLSKSGSKRLNDRRNLFAKSKFFLRKHQTCPDPSNESTSTKSKSEDLTNSSQTQSTIKKKSFDSTVTYKNTMKISTSLHEKDNFDSIKNTNNLNVDNTNLPKKTLFKGTNSFKVPKTSNYLDPNWISMYPRVQENLIHFHNQINKKPTLLQTSYISKSDSNLKVKTSFKLKPNEIKNKFNSLNYSHENQVE